MATYQLPPRIWNIDANTLLSLGFDAGSIRAHAATELGEDLNWLTKKEQSKEISTMDSTYCQKVVRNRHRSNWGSYSNA